MGTQNQAVELNFSIFTGFNYWNKQISCQTRPSSPKLDLELGYFNSYGCWERIKITSISFLDDTKPYR